MKHIFIHGIGAVSPAGWDVPLLCKALTEGVPLPTVELARPGWEAPLKVRRVGGRANPIGAHARLRRTSPISLYAASAALEALSIDTNGPRVPCERLGIVVSVTSGCVQFSRRFYDEAWRQPATASPLIFPETVFNAPASHLSAILQSQAPNYTLVGDPGTFLQGLALAADWLLEDRVDGCLIVGAEEMDWLTADAQRHFSRQLVCSEGAGAVYLRCEPPAGADAGVELVAITDSYLYLSGKAKREALRRMSAALPRPASDALLCDSCVGVDRRDAAESDAWAGWGGARLSPQRILGDGLAAGAAWQCAAAIDHLQQGRGPAALVSVAGTHQQAIGACFARVS
jgi:hypothetical protein